MRTGAEQGTLSPYSTSLWLGLEPAKPFSIAGAFDAFQSSRFGQGAAVALLGLVAVSYSLSAEISLRVSMLSDRVAERAATSNIANNVRDKYRRTKFELDGLPAARITGERQALT